MAADATRLLDFHLGYLVLFLGDCRRSILNLAPVLEVGHDGDHDLSVPGTPVVKRSAIDLLTVLVRPGMLLPLLEGPLPARVDGAGERIRHTVSTHLL